MLEIFETQRPLWWEGQRPTEHNLAGLQNRGNVKLTLSMLILWNSLIWGLRQERLNFNSRFSVKILPSRPRGDCTHCILSVILEQTICVWMAYSHHLKTTTTVVVVVVVVVVVLFIPVLWVCSFSTTWEWFKCIWDFHGSRLWGPSMPQPCSGS